MFWASLRVVAAVLGAGLIAIALFERKRLRTLHRSELFTRLATWAVIAPIYVVAVLSGHVAALVFVSALSFQALREYSRLAALPRRYTWVLLGLGLLAAPAALYSQAAFYTLPAMLLLAATLQPLLVPDIRAGVRHLAFATFGWGYLAWLLGHFMLIHLYVSQGAGLLLALGLGVALSDVGAFTVGKTIGKHKLAPRLSPNKTWEGFAGNVVGAYAGVALMRFALPDDLPWAIGLALPLVIALGSLWGDLLESALKREAQVKDAGGWLPGFGGLLDRIDSFVIVTPLVYYLVRVPGLW